MERGQWIQIAQRLGIDPIDLLAAVADAGHGGSDDVSAADGSADGQRLGYSIREVASALGISNDLVRSMVQRGELKAIRLGRRVVIPAVELERYVQQPACETLHGTPR
ncbi:MAG: helix-turn-helix domain-containing protein [Acidimicrobiales bacterium]